MPNPKFPLGQVVATRGVAERMEDYPTFQTGVMQSLDRHVRGDWGEVDDEDKQTNDDALLYGNRLLSTYTIDGTKIWIITERDRSVTTVLFPDEY